MSDLLTSLVDRALERAPVLQRRQPTLFEPAAEAAFNERAQVATPRTIHEENILLENDPATESGRPEFKSQEPRLHPRTRAHDETESGDVESQSSLHRRPPKVATPLRAERETEPPRSSDAAKHADLTPNPVIREDRSSRSIRTDDNANKENAPVASARMIETIIEKRVEREIVSETVKGAPTIREAQTVHPPAEVSKAAPEDDGNTKPPVKLKSKPLDPAKDGIPIKPLTQQKPLTRREDSPLIRAVPKAESMRAIKQPPAPPAIHVTIGRVEVRATPQPPARPKFARAAGPRVSLEDYLRSRGEGN